jgi:hypothetical protein
MKSLFLFILLSCFSQGLFASDAVILKDGSVVLADVFLDQDADQLSNRPKAIALNPRLILQAKLYAQFMDQRILSILEDKDGPNFLDLIDPQDIGFLHYIVKDVEELGKFCSPGTGKRFILESNENISKVACSVGKETYFVGPSFVKLSLQEQALVIIHERFTLLRDDRGGRDFGNVGKVVTMARSFLRIAYEQQQRNFRTLENSELLAIESFYSSLIYLLSHNISQTYAFTTNWKIHPNGGGILLASPNVDPEAFIDHSSKVVAPVIIKKRARIINTELGDQVFIGEDVIIESSLFDFFTTSASSLRLEDGSSIIKSNLNNSDLVLGRNSILRDSQISDVSLKIGKGVLINDSRIDFTDDHKEFEIISKEVLQHAVITSATNQNYAPKGIELDYSGVDINEENLNKIYFSNSQQSENDIPKSETQDGTTVTVLRQASKVVRDTYSFEPRWNITLLSYTAQVRFFEVNPPELDRDPYMISGGHFLPCGKYRFRSIFHINFKGQDLLWRAVGTQIYENGGKIFSDGILLPMKELE